VVAPEIPDGDPFERLRVGRARCLPSNWTADEVDQHVVVPRAALGVEADAFERRDRAADFDLETRLFAHFARDGRLERFSSFDGAAGDAPFAFERFASAPYEQHAIAVQDHRADTDDRTRRIFAIVSHEP